VLVDMVAEPLLQLVTVLLKMSSTWIFPRTSSSGSAISAMSPALLEMMPESTMARYVHCVSSMLSNTNTTAYMPVCENVTSKMPAMMPADLTVDLHINARPRMMLGAVSISGTGSAVYRLSP